MALQTIALTRHPTSETGRQEDRIDLYLTTSEVHPDVTEVDQRWSRQGRYVR
jgi:hypothetical protein